MNDINEPYYRFHLSVKDSYNKAERFVKYLIGINPNITLVSSFSSSIGSEEKYDNTMVMAKKDIEPTEYKKKCLVCGHVFCYTKEDLDRNKKHERNSTLAALGTIAGALAGPSYSMVENRKLHDRERDKIVDYSKCPHCNSSDLVDFDDEMVAAKKDTSSGQNAVYSVADEIKKYKELLDMGAITQEEFEAKKKQLLGL